SPKRLLRKESSPLVVTGQIAAQSRTGLGDLVLRTPVPHVNGVGVPDCGRLVSYHADGAAVDSNCENVTEAVGREHLTCDLLSRRHAPYACHSVVWRHGDEIGAVRRERHPRDAVS